MAEQAHTDWTRFLELRADELVEDGTLLVNMMGVPDGGTAAGKEIWELTTEIAAEMAGEGLIDGDALEEYVIPIYERTPGEVRRPFDERVGNRLELRSEHIATIGNPASDAYRENGDAAAFARKFTAFFRAFSEPSLKTGLAADEAAIDKLYGQIEARLESRADTFVFEINALTIVARKR